MTRFFRDVLIIARHELLDAVRSRRAFVVLILYLAGAMVACNTVITWLHRLEGQLTKMLKLPPSSVPGAVVDGLWKSAEFRKGISHLIGDATIVEELVQVHPMAIIFAWLAFTFTPGLVMLSASPRIADELGTGSARFVALRTSRHAWCLGKYLGQAFMVLVALSLSAIGCWALSRLRLNGMDDLATARWMIIYAWKAWVYALAYLGVALGVSQLTRSPNKATAMAFFLWIVLAALGGVSWHFLKNPDSSYAWKVINLAVPLGHRLDVWRMSLATQVRAMTCLVILGLTYLYAGYAVLSRRDL